MPCDLFRSRLLASILILWAAGCGSYRLPRDWRPSYSRPPGGGKVSPPSPQAPVESPPVTSIRPPRQSRETPAESAKPEQPKPKTPAVTLGNDVEARASAQKQIDQVTFKVHHIDRPGLAGVNASTYDQANELLNAAQKALADRDYLAASSLADKASALANQLPPQAH
jgi:hypothetical protein